MQFNRNPNYTYKFYHEGFEYLKNTTNDRAAKYLNNNAWIDWDTNMVKQKTIFKRIAPTSVAPTSVASSPDQITDLETLRDVIIDSFNIDVSKLDLGTATPTGRSRGEDKLDLILNMIPIGLTQFYNRRAVVPNNGSSPNLLNEYAYLHGNDSIPPSPPITFSYDNLDNVIGDVAFRLFRQHNTKNVYFTKVDPNPTQHPKVFPLIIENYEFAKRDIWKLDYFRKDKLPTWDNSANMHIINTIPLEPGRPNTLPPDHYGSISQNIESF